MTYKIESFITTPAKSLKAVQGILGKSGKVADELQHVLISLAVTAHKHGDIRPVQSALDELRTSGHRSLNLNRVADWLGRNLPAHYSTAKSAWVFNAKKRKEVNNELLAALHLDIWYADADGKVHTGFKPLDPAARLKAQLKAWTKAHDEHGAESGVSNTQINVLLEAIAALEAL